MKHKLLLGIIVLASILRLTSLSTHPVGFTPDEASFGYDAYSILKTGQDQWGNFLPLSLKSFGDYKMPLYTYLTIPSVAIFGLNIFATRLPNAIFGIVAVFATYLFVSKLFKNEKLALVSSLFLAISPWHIALSRGAFEANLTTSLLTLGLYFLVKAQENRRNYLYAFLFFGLNMFTYHTARILTFPIIVFAYFLLFPNVKKAVNESRKYFAVFIGFIVAAVATLFSGSAGRLATSNIFSLSENAFIDRLAFINVGLPEIFAKIFHNKFLYVLEIFIKKYLEYFSPQFLFLEGAREATYGMIPGVGVLYFFEIITILFAIKYLIFNFGKKEAFLCLWILASVFPAALSLGPGLAANRVAFMMPALQILSAIGFIEFYKYVTKFVNKKLVIYATTFVLLVSLIKFMELNWFVQPAKGADAMIAGTEQVFDYVDSIEGQYQTIIVDKKISEAHIYIAFYNKIDPKIVQDTSKNWNFEAIGRSWVDQLPEYNLGKYLIRDIDWQRDLRVANSLIIYKGPVLPEIASPVKVFTYPDGTNAYYLIDTHLNVFAKK